MADVLGFISHHVFLLRLRIIDIDVDSFLGPLVEVGQVIAGVKVAIASEADDGLVLLVPDVKLGVLETPTLLVVIVKLDLFCQTKNTYLD